MATLHTLIVGCLWVIGVNNRSFLGLLLGLLLAFMYSKLAGDLGLFCNPRIGCNSDDGLLADLGVLGASKLFFSAEPIFDLGL